jgi:serine/threonine-protein kinase
VSGGAAAAVLEYLESFEACARERVPQLNLEGGIAGLAYAAYLLGESTGAAGFFVQAHRIAGGAERFENDAGAFAWAYGSHPFERIAHQSVLHGPIGTATAFALAAHAANDEALKSRQLQRLEALARARFEQVEFAFGVSGALWAVTRALRAGIAEEPLRALARRLYEATWTMYRRFAARVAEGRTKDLLGFAHGRAGILFALAAYRVAIGEPATAELSAELERLALLGAVDRRGISWSSVQPPDEQPEAWPGVRESWCNGVAGYVPLWSLAYELTGEPVYRTLALKAATYLVRDGVELFSPSLCCGLAAHAVAFTLAQRLEAQRDWLSFARRAAAMCGLGSTLRLTPQSDGFLKQALGVFLEGTAWL